jgi:hypothetical protein
MRLPAYIDGVAAPTRVRLDGPSLLVERPERAAQRLPFGRLARLVVRGPVAFDAGALPALLRQGASLALLAGDGRALGFCVPLLPRPDDLVELVEAAALRADWPAPLEALLAAEERLAVAWLARRLAFARVDPRRRVLERHLGAALAERLGPAAPLDADALRARLAALLRAELAQGLIAHGIGARWQDPRRPERDLAAFACRILALELWPTALVLAAYLRRHAAKHADEARLQRRLVAAFEAGRERRARLLARLLGRLRRCLLELEP